MNKKTSVNELRNRITKIVKEEVKKALFEDVNPLFDKIPRSKQDDFKGWVMRQYFNPSKHSDKIWYDRSVTKDNVLDYISSQRGQKLFPNTPRNLVNLWKLKSDLSSRLGATVRDLEKAEKKDKEEEEKAKYQTGDVSLKDIGQELGGVTPTMINKLATSGMEKFAKLTKDVSPSEMEYADVEDMLNKIETARQEVAKEFAKKLKEANSVDEFLKTLAKEHILTPTDLKIISPEEIEGLEILMDKSEDRIAMILIEDIEDDDNLFKTYQSAVSKKVHPPAKRGRPKKKKD